MLKIKTTPTPYWTKTIEEARERGEFTEDQTDLAADWVTCACGKQDSRIPREDHPGAGSIPVDLELTKLGHNFYMCVCMNNFDGAEQTLDKIEFRSAQILLEQQS